MELKNIHTFIAVTECGSFSAAAEKLSYAQSTVTAQIAALEEELHVSLFHRAGKKASLSSEGSQFLVYCRRLLKTESELFAHFSPSGDPSGTLRLGMVESVSHTYGSRLLCEYGNACPSVSLAVSIATTLELLKALRENRLDCVITLDDPVTAPDIELLWRHAVPVSFFCSRFHPFASKPSVSFEELAAEPLFLTEKGCNYRHIFELEAAKRGFLLNCPLEIGSTSVLVHSVLERCGVSLLPQFTLSQAEAAGQIRLFQVPGFSISMHVQLLCSRDRWISPAIRRLASLCTQDLKW